MPTAASKQDTQASTLATQQQNSLISVDIILKVCVPILLAVCGFLYSEIKEVRENQQKYVTQIEFQEGLQSVTSSVNSRLDSLDSKVNILVSSALNNNNNRNRR